jgi:hypothetical protein
MTLASAPYFSRASATVSQTGSVAPLATSPPVQSEPPLPGVTPAVIFVP